MQGCRPARNAVFWNTYSDARYAEQAPELAQWNGPPLGLKSGIMKELGIMKESGIVSGLGGEVRKDSLEPHTPGGASASHSSPPEAG